MATDYGWGSHFNWLLRNYRPEGRLAVIGPVLDHVEVAQAHVPGVGEVQHLGAVGEQRRAAFAQVEPPRVELHQRSQQCRRLRALQHAQRIAVDQPLE